MSVTIVSKRSKEELEQIQEKHGHLLMAGEDFELVNSPLGPLWLDKMHPDYVKIIEQCIVWCKMNGDLQTVEKYQKLILSATQSPLCDERGSSGEN